MYRDSEDSDRDVVHVELLVAEGIGNIPSTNVSRRLYIGYMQSVNYQCWDFRIALRINHQDLTTHYDANAEDVWAARTQDAFHVLIRNHSANITQALLDSEGEVFNPITNETRSPYPLNNIEPLQGTWIRISDDEDALASVWDAEFKKLAGAVVPVKKWDNHDRTHRRPQKNIWAIIDIEYTRTFGMSTGVGLPPHLWTIIDPRTNEDIPIIDPAEEAAWLLKEYHQHVADLEEIERLNTLNEQREDYSAGIAYPEPEPAVEPEQRAMNQLKDELATERLLLAQVLEQISTLSEAALNHSKQIAEMEAQYAKHRHLDKEVDA